MDCVKIGIPPPKTNLKWRMFKELTPDQLKPNKNVILQICEDNNLDQIAKPIMLVIASQRMSGVRN